MLSSFIVFLAIESTTTAIPKMATASRRFFRNSDIFKVFVVISSYPLNRFESHRTCKNWCELCVVHDV